MSDETDYGRYSPEQTPSGEEELYYIILRLVEQSCGQKDGTEFDSFAISAYEHALESLAQAGLVEMEPEGRICGKITPSGRNFAAWMEYHERRKRPASSW
jgi:hypothetical protein